MTQTSIHVSINPGPDTAKQIAGQVSRAIRMRGRAPSAVTRPAPAVRVPFRREELFQEPAYADGGPYDQGDEDDDTD